MQTNRKAVVVLAALVVVLTALAGGAADAKAAPVNLDGVRTKLFTDPATTGVLLRNGVIPLPVKPAAVWPRFAGGFSLAYRFPITGGRVDSETLAGTIDHSGGLRFVNLANWKSLKLTNFRILITDDPGLTAAVNGDPGTRVRILDLDLSDAEIERAGRRVRVRGVDATLTQTAAEALNATLGVSFFAAGIDLGQANVVARVAR